MSPWCMGKHYKYAGFRWGCWMRGSPPPEMGIALHSHGAVPIHIAPGQHRGMDWSCKKRWEGTEEAERAEEHAVEPGTLPVIVGS